MAIEMNNIIENSFEDKISVQDFIDDNTLLELTYIPFEQKVRIVSYIFSEAIKQFHGLNTAMLKFIAMVTFINTITNIDMSLKDDNGLDGYDQLKYKNKLNDLLFMIKNEYDEFDSILNDYISDFNRIASNNGDEEIFFDDEMLDDAGGDED